MKTVCWARAGLIGIGMVMPGVYTCMFGGEVDEVEACEKTLFRLMPLLNQKVQSAFCVAVKKGHIDTARFLYAYDGGARDVECSDEQGWTLLHWATFHGHAKLVELLHEWGARLEARNNDDCAPIHLAALQGHRRIVEFLDRKGASTLPLDSDNKSPFVRAVMAGHRGVAKYLYTTARDIPDECAAALSEAKNRGDNKLIQWMCHKQLSKMTLMQNDFTE